MAGWGEKKKRESEYWKRWQGLAHGLKAKKGYSPFPKGKHYLSKDDLLSESFTDLLLTTDQP